VATHVSPAGLGSARAVTRTLTHRTVTGTGLAGPLWVSSTAPLAGGKSCTKPDFSTISAALAVAAAGATINVCGGTYDEQLVITQGVKLNALGAVTVVGPASPASTTSCDADGGSQPNEDVVDICTTGSANTKVSITGFSIEGNWPADVCNDSLYGVAVLGGADLTMTNTTVEGAGGDPQTDGCQGGVGIQVGEATSATAADRGSATLTNDVVNTYQKNGITIDGAGSSAVLKTDTVTGTGETTAIAQNGIQVSDGATANISDALVTGNECDNAACGSGPLDTQATGILLFDAAATKVSNSTVNGNDDGIYNVEDYTYEWPYWAPPAGWTPVNESFSKLTMNNRYESAAFDSGKSTLSGSTLTGGETGLAVLQYSGQPIPAMATATTDTITDATTAAVWVASDQNAGDVPVKLSVTTSDFGATNFAGVENDSTSIVTATKDWWGDVSGPSVWSFGSGSSVTSDVTFFPWSTNAGNTVFESCSTRNNQTTSDNDVVLCAVTGTSTAYLANAGSGNVLLIGNRGNDQLVGSGAGETWIIGGTPGNNVINEEGGTGFLQERGNGNDLIIDSGTYTTAAN
jgi:hypothetical protein